MPAGYCTPATAQPARAAIGLEYESKPQPAASEHASTDQPPGARHASTRSPATTTNANNADHKQT